MRALKAVLIKIIFLNTKLIRMRYTTKTVSRILHRVRSHSKISLGPSLQVREAGAMGRCFHSVARKPEDTNPALPTAAHSNAQSFSALQSVRKLCRDIGPAREQAVHSLHVPPWPGFSGFSQVLINVLPGSMNGVFSSFLYKRFYKTMYFKHVSASE